MVPVSEIQDSSKQANPMFSSIPIHIYLTTSINIRLTHGSRTTVANTRFHKKARLIRKAFRKRLLVSLSNPIQSQEKSLYIHGHPNKLPPNGGDKCCKCDNKCFSCHAAHLQFSSLSLEIEFNTVRLVTYTICRLCSTLAAVQ